MFIGFLTSLDRSIIGSQDIKDILRTLENVLRILRILRTLI